MPKCQARFLIPDESGKLKGQFCSPPLAYIQTMRAGGRGEQDVGTSLRSVLSVQTHTMILYLVEHNEQIYIYICMYTH